MFKGDTIAAISTPPGRGGIGVVRLSGPSALEIADSIFASESRAADAPNRAVFGRLVDPASGEVIDEVIRTYFKAPHSYTGEDVIELSCHGSPVILTRALGLAAAGGARIAEPGEFTFRAFLNKRLDLTQAQAVRDLIDAQTDYQARVATRQLGGALSGRLTPLKDELVEIIVHLESSLEFVEDDISTDEASALLAKIDRVIEELSRMSESFAFGRFIHEGFDLALVGRPNVGKSSIFNRLVGSDRAIVTEVPGTTRDALYEAASISGVPVRLIDTAGIRETTDMVESLGIGRSRRAIADADISILVLDSSEPLTDDDIRLLNEVPEDRRIIVYNKVDLLGNLQPGFLEPEGGLEVLNISALTGEGFGRLIEALFERLSGDAATERDGIMITDARQHRSVRGAIEKLYDARDLMKQSESEEVILLRLHSALFSLGEITGETLTEDILTRIFSTFCVGK
ncbi:MAG TPA: tRNA uridine-5-carboxymethylaminomethyl(34) synthesis GTPase MnmE [Blastocatellia bacterium]|nr:tRNA uridine-5-carboxymethylaminomethyl(34) synthesis GTPase MnmE [Blastocatellia bacterium]